MATNSIKFSGEVSEMSSAWFCRQLEELAPRSSATIYLHTPGGDIYAGGEMINAVRSAMKRGCKLSFEIGSLCASMGAALLAAAKASGCKAKCHPNSEVMFHGCWSLVVGGADELTDQAKAMRDFNECVKRDLKKCGIDETDEWFAADRNKWLNADELLSLGLVDEILETASVDPEDLKDSAVKIAALLNHPKQEKQMEQEETIKAEEKTVEETSAAPEAETTTEEPKADETTTEEPTQEAVETVAPTADEIEAKVTALANQRFAGLQAKHEKMISDLVKERDVALKDLEAAKATATSLQADIEKLEADLVEVRDQLAKSEHNHASIVADALMPSAELPTLTDALAACKTLAERAEVLKSENYKH